jgi:colanic acid biosynthesis glycosyl transferase WcaI
MKYAGRSGPTRGRDRAKQKQLKSATGVHEVKILIYSANFAPEPTGIGKYSGEMATWLAHQGHSVRVIAAPPYYPAWRIERGYRWPPYRRDEMNGVDVWRAPLWVPANPNGVARLVHLASFALFSLPVVLIGSLWRPDVVLTVAPFLTCAPGGWLAARLAGAQAWLHIQDFEVDAAVGLGLLPKAIQRFALACERALLDRFDAISSISDRMVERLHAKGVAPARTFLFPNWIDTDKIRPLGRLSKYRTELGIGAATVVVLFSGTLGPKQGLEIVSQAAIFLAKRVDVLFLICGDGVVKAKLERDCAALANVRLLPLQPAEQLSELLNLADIHLLTQSPDVEDLVLPSKLTGMLASGRPIIATCREGTEIASVVATCGEIVPPGNAGALADAVVRLAEDSGRRQTLGQMARKFAESRLALDAVLDRAIGELAACRQALAPTTSDCR